jgi:hypothetical protein
MSSYPPEEDSDRRWLCIVQLAWRLRDAGLTKG